MQGLKQTGTTQGCYKIKSSFSWPQADFSATLDIGVKSDLQHRMWQGIKT